MFHAHPLWTVPCLMQLAAPHGIPPCCLGFPLPPVRALAHLPLWVWLLDESCPQTMWFLSSGLCAQLRNQITAWLC